MLENRLLTAKLRSSNPNPVTKLPNDELMRFANYAGSADTKAQAAYLAKKGLLGASDIYHSIPDTSNAFALTSAQADWKPAKVGSMLMTAKRLGITPKNIDANWDVVIGNDRYGAAIKDPNFQVIHKNFKDVFKNLLAEQYAKEKTPANDIAKK